MQTSSGAHPAPNSVATGGKVRDVCNAD